jgi:hypothetical protein
VCASTTLRQNLLADASSKGSQLTLPRMGKADNIQPLLSEDHQQPTNGLHNDSEDYPEQQDEERGTGGEGSPNLTPAGGNSGVRGSTFIPAVLNLSKVILGSGMLVGLLIGKACAQSAC